MILEMKALWNHFTRFLNSSCRKKINEQKEESTWKKFQPCRNKRIRSVFFEREGRKWEGVAMVRIQGDCFWNNVSRLMRASPFYSSTRSGWLVHDVLVLFFFLLFPDISYNYFLVLSLKNCDSKNSKTKKKLIIKVKRYGKPYI